MATKETAGKAKTIPSKLVAGGDAKVKGYQPSYKNYTKCAPFGGRGGKGK